MNSQYKLLSKLLSDQAAFITSPKTSLANYWGGIAPPSVYGPALYELHYKLFQTEDIINYDTAYLYDKPISY